MNFKEFQVLSTRTQVFGGKPGNHIELKAGLLNYAIGAMAEWFEFQNELSKVKIDEVPDMKLVNDIHKELGDVLHYLVGLLTFMDHEVNEELFETINNESLIYQDLANIGEIVKKHIFHGHEFEKEKFVKSIYRVLSYINTHHSLAISDIMNKNIEKLKKRYPEKFTAADSIARVDTK